MSTNKTSMVEWSFTMLNNAFSDFFVADCNHRRTDAYVYVSPNDPDYDDAVEEANHYATRDAERVAGIVASLLYKKRGSEALRSLRDAVDYLDHPLPSERPAFVVVDDVKCPSDQAIECLLNTYDIDTNSKIVLRAAGAAFRKAIRETGKLADEYYAYICGLLDYEGSTMDALMEREPFVEWVKAHRKQEN